MVFFNFNLIQNLVHIKSNSQFAPRQDQLSLCCCQPNSRLLITTVILPYCLFNKIFQILFKWKTKRIIPVQRSSKNMKERLSLDLEDYSLAAQKALVTKLLLCFFLQGSFSCHRLPQYSFTVYTGQENLFRPKKHLKTAFFCGKKSASPHFGKIWRPNCWHQVNFWVTPEKFGV